MIATLFSSFISVAHATPITISTSVPGMSTTAPSSPGAFVVGFYKFALMIGGVLAFGVIVFGGVKYMTAAGNPSGQSDAKEWIEAALLGLLLLVGAYFILNVVNPQLTNLSLPTLQPVNLSSAPPGCNISCASGTVPTVIGGPNTPEPTASCVCQDATGAQGCGGAVQGTIPCPSTTSGYEQVCVNTASNPLEGPASYQCEQSCGSPPNYYGACESDIYSCTNINKGTTPQTVVYGCTLTD